MNYDFYDNFDMYSELVPNNNYNNSLNLYHPYEGYIKGNMFKDLYKPYKKYQEGNIKINSEKDEMLAKIGEDHFVMHDLNLYLDVNPNDQEALNKFMEYRNKLNNDIKNYERRYGPLDITSEENDNNNFSWVSTWPWK